MGVAISGGEMNAFLLTVGGLWLVSLVLMFRALSRSYAAHDRKLGAKRKRTRRRSWPELKPQADMPIMQVVSGKAATVPMRRVA